MNYAACKFLDVMIPNLLLLQFVVAGVYLAETINTTLGNNWKNFAGQNYFDPHGLFFSVLWSGPLLFIAIIILVRNHSHLLLFMIFFSFLLFFSSPCFLFRLHLAVWPAPAPGLVVGNLNRNSLFEL